MSPLVVLGVLGAAVVVGGAVAVSRAVEPFWQGASQWGGLKLGLGTSTISAGGCLLTLFTMATNTLRRPATKLTPDVVNELLKDARAFFVDANGVGTSNLIVEAAAPALGLKLRGRVRQDFNARGELVQQPTLQEIRAVVDGALNAGGLAVVQVNHDGGVRGQHFVLVNGRKKDGSYTAADPAPGKVVPLDKSLGGQVRWGSKVLPYRAVAAFGLVV